MGKGIVISESDKKPDKWHDIAPGSIAHNLWKAACKK